MRYIDEVLALYSGKDAFTRKFILAQILDHPVDRFAGDIADRLDEETRADDALVRRQARFTLGQLLPGEAALAHGLCGERKPRLSAGAAAWLAPQLDELSALMLERGSTQERAAASFVLGRLHTPRVIDGLVAQVAGVAQVSWQAAFALAEAGNEAAVDALVQAVGEHAPARPDLCLLLRAVPCPAVLRCLEAQEAKVDAVGRSNIALALAPYASHQCRDLLDRLVRRREGWVTAYVLDTLAGHGDPDDLALIKRAWDLEPHEFIRVQAVRAAGTIRSAGARAFCHEVLSTGSERLQSVALEALAGQDVPIEELAAIARGFFDSPFVRTRIQAMLVVARQDPDAAAGEISRLVLSPEPLLRVEGAFVAGIVQGPGSRALLERMAARDRSASVRVQAIKSLARFPAGEAAPALSGSLAQGSLPLVVTACRALGSLPEPALAADALAEALATAATPAARAAMLAAFGEIGQAAGRPPADALLDGLRDVDPVIVAGALDGLRFAGDRIPVQAVMPLLVGADARVRARAAAVVYFAGQPELTGALTALLASGDETAVLEAIRSLREIALVSPYLGSGTARLVAQLEARTATPMKPSVGHMLPGRVAGKPDESERRLVNQRKIEILKALAEGVMSGPGQVFASGKDLHALAGAYDSTDQNAVTAPSMPVVVPFTPEQLPRPLTRAYDAPSVVPGARGSSRRVQVPAIETPARPRWLPAAVAICVLVLGVLLWPARRDPRPVVPVASSALARSLRVWAVRGGASAVRGGAPSAPLEVGMDLGPGDRAATGPSATLELKAGAPVHVELAATSGLSVVASAPGAPLALEEPAGEVLVRAAEREVHVYLGNMVYRVSAGQVRVVSVANGWSVEQVDGDGALQSPSGARDIMVVGQKRTVVRLR